MQQVLASESLTRVVLGEVIATAIFRIFQPLESLGIQVVPVGRSMNWTLAGPWLADFCNDGYCLRVRIKPDRTFELQGAWEEHHANAVPQRFGTGWAGGYGLPRHDRAFSRLVNRLEEHGIEVTHDYDSCPGWNTLVCVYANGTLASCHTHARCD